MTVVGSSGCGVISREVLLTDMVKSESGSKYETPVGCSRTCKRWNPVYPTYGAFWGLGIGLGCGVGWGPGFGPDGYSGAGCGLGFSVGMTIICFGVGVPTSGLACVPHNLLSWTSKEARKRATSHAIPALIFGFKQCREAWEFRSIAIKRELGKLFERVCLPTSRKVLRGIQRKVSRGFPNINGMTPSRLSYRLETKALRGLHEVSRDFASRDIAGPHDNQDRVSLEYVGEDQESCGQVVRFSKTSKRFRK